MITPNQIGIIVGLILGRMIVYPDESLKDYLIYACICFLVGIPLYSLFNYFWSLL